MHLTHQVLLSLPLLPRLVVHAGLINPLHSKMVSLTDPSKLARIPGLQGLDRYVCPPQYNTNYLERRAYEEILPPVPRVESPAEKALREKLRGLLEQVNEVERQMRELIGGGTVEEEEGEGDEVTKEVVDLDTGMVIDAGVPEGKEGDESEESLGESVDAGSTTSPLPTSENENENASITPPNNEEETETETETPITPIKAGPSSEPSISGVQRPNVLPLPLPNETTPPPFSLTNTTTNYKFNPLSHSNVAVYFGQTPHSISTPLSTLCESQDIDIIVLAFITSRTSGSSLYPTLNLAGTCTTQTPLMREKAPGLISCPELAEEIKTCQGVYGKKVLLSIGGATADVRFETAQQARTFGDVIWGLFGPQGSVEGGLRPFGSVVLDGFDIDNENRLPTYFKILATTLRTHFTNHTSFPTISPRQPPPPPGLPSSTKDFYLSSAPQCPFPDASNPLPMLLDCDFVFVQFYNNPSCDIGSAGFLDSVKQWSKALSKSEREVKPRLYIGAPGWKAAGPSAYANGIGGPKGVGKVVGDVLEGLGEVREVGGLGGWMFWDGPESILNVEDGKSILGWAKKGLNSLNLGIGKRSGRSRTWRRSQGSRS